MGVASSDSSSSESEDDEGVWSPQTETDFLRTLSLLKKKDPQIYDKNVTFYSSVEHQKPSSGHTQTKAVYLKDYERERLLDRGRYSMYLFLTVYYMYSVLKSNFTYASFLPNSVDKSLIASHTDITVKLT